MDYQILNDSDYVLSQWSGGQTTQFLMVPPHSRLEERHFLFRISSAIVANETSTFSDFSGYQRIILPLKGQIRLDNQGRHEQVTLDPFEVYEFDGGDRIVSWGRCRDYNLIYQSGLSGKVSFLGSTAQRLPSMSWGHLFALDKALISVHHDRVEAIPLSKGQSLFISPCPMNITLLALKTTVQPSVIFSIVSP